MTLESPQHQGETNDPFASLSPYEFVLLTTFRNSGVGVPTAMWFAHEHGKLYVRNRVPLKGTGLWKQAGPDQTQPGNRLR
jgi:hypothetical protein